MDKSFKACVRVCLYVDVWLCNDDELFGIFFPLIYASSHLGSCFVSVCCVTRKIKQFWGVFENFSQLNNVSLAANIYDIGCVAG